MTAEGTENNRVNFDAIMKQLKVQEGTPMMVKECTISVKKVEELLATSQQIWNSIYTASILKLNNTQTQELTVPSRMMGSAQNLSEEV